MSKLKIYIIIAVVFTISVNATASLRIYLLSSVSPSKNIKISNIAHFEGSDIEVNQIANIQIPQKILEDGFIDRRELYNFVRNSIKTPFLIYGSSVKVNKAELNEDVDDSVILIKSKSQVKVTVKKNGIKIITSGKILRNGYLNKLIKVKLVSGKIVKGIVKSKKEVLIEL